MHANILTNGIEYFSKGNITKDAIVFIHGNSLNAKTFSEQFDQIRDIPMIALNLQGHGNSFRSKDPENEYCLPGFVNSVINSLKELNVKDFILAGHSLGGHVAIECIHEIDGIKGLYVFGTPPIGMPPRMEDMFLPNPNVGYLFTDALSEEQQLVIANEMVNNNPDLAVGLKEYISQTDPAFRKNMGLSVGAGKFKNELEILANSQLPFVLANGKHDSMINLSYFNNIKVDHTLIQKQETFDRSGHTPQLETSDSFNKSLITFYRSVFN